MRKIFLSAGHTNIVGRDRGAAATHVLPGETVAQTFVEGTLAAEFCGLLFRKLFSRGIPVYLDPFNNDLSAALKAVRPLVKPKDICIEYHWNSFHNPKATGTEVVIPGRAGKGKEHTDFEKLWATNLAKNHAEILEINNRGVKTEALSQHKSLGWMRLPAETLLVEFAFISNPHDVAAYKNNLTMLVENEADSLEVMSSC